MERNAIVNRKTNETDIVLALDLDGSGTYNVDTGIGFFDHMLESFARHGFFDLELSCKGDITCDSHHTVEDCGIVLGSAIKQALGSKEGITRYGSCILPMDETLVMCAVDLCDRPYLVFDMELPAEKVGYLETETIREFFYAISYSAGMNLHLKLIHGTNTHHIIEAAFKAFARSLSAAAATDPRVSGLLSTKGSL